MKKSFLVLFALVAGIGFRSQAQFTLLQDLNPDTINGTSAGPLQFLFLPGKGILVFFAYHPSYGVELWKTDGTPGGGQLVKDIVPGVNGVIAGTHYTKLIAAYDRAYFEVTDSSGTELWVTDGTAAGTHIVTDFRPGSASSYPTVLMTDSIYAIVYADDGVAKQVYKTDGTSAGTVKFGGTAVQTIPFACYKYNGKYYYGLNSGTLYSSDGTSKSQVVAGQLSAPPAIANGGILAGDTFYYGTLSGSSGPDSKLMKIHAAFSTPELVLQRTQTIGSNIGNPYYFKMNDQGFMFVIQRSFLGGAVTYELFQYHLNSYSVTCIDTVNGNNASSFSYFANYKGRTYFSTYLGTSTNINLVSTDGTAKSLVELSASLMNNELAAPVIFRDTMYFINNTNSALYRTAGTSASTERISPASNKVMSNSAIGAELAAAHFHNFNDTALVFGGYYKQGSLPTWAELWRFSGPVSFTAVNEVTAFRKQVVVYPNPAASVVTFAYPASPNAAVSIYDVNGRLVSKGIANTELNVDGWKAGVYFFIVSSEAGSEKGRFVVE